MYRFVILDAIMPRLDIKRVEIFDALFGLDVDDDDVC